MNSTIRKQAPVRLPEWLKVDLPGHGHYYNLRQRLKKLGLHTVCEEARCPNIADCWGGGTATFMILGKICTRGCRFCDVISGKPSAPPNPDEADNVALACTEMNIRHVVITSVDRDDLDDQGATHFAQVIRTVKARLPKLTIEVLTPDFQGTDLLLERVCAAGADVLAHNLETVRSLTPTIRDARSDYDISLKVLRYFRAHDPTKLVKSSLMLGLGESDAEIKDAMQDLRNAGVDWLTIGQYLRPTRKHAPVQRFVPPDIFSELADIGRKMGFPIVNAGPLVRSSYRAGEAGAAELIRSRRDLRGASAARS